MAKIYFNKKIFSNAFIINGARAPFEQIGDNQGLLALETDDPANKDLIEALNKAAHEQRGGVLKIDEATYSDLKKNKPYQEFVSVSKRRSQLLQVAPSSIPKKPSKPADASLAVPVNKPDDKGEPGWENAPRNAAGLRLDGPTKQEWVKKGFKAENYPPNGYAERTTPAETDPALKAFRPKTKKLTDELKGE